MAMFSSRSELVACSQVQDKTAQEKALLELFRSCPYVSEFKEGFFAVLMNELRWEIWKFLDQNIDFARASRVNKRWHSEMQIAWYSSAKKKGYFAELEFYEKQNKSWKWVIRTKTVEIDAKVLDKFTGVGFINEDNGAYAGDFVEGKKHGLGKKSYESSTYSGYWENSKKSGFGIYTWQDGTIYDGHWKEDKYHGKGRKKWQNGDEYDGEWKEDKKHGYGIYRWSTGDQYSGEWEEDIQSGKGVMKWNSGDQYIGGFKNNMFEGHGVYNYAVGDKYEGEWKRNDRCGVAVYFYRYGGIFRGNFQNDERNGSGQYFWPEGDSYQGVWKDGSRVGKGIFLNLTTQKKIEQIWTAADEAPHANYSMNVPRKWPNNLTWNSVAN